MAKIEDGKGTGRLAEVDTSNRLSVVSVSSDRAEAANIDREAFVLASEIFSIGAGAEHRVFYFSNGEAARDLVIDLEKFSTDGGSTSNNKPVTMKCYVNASEPSANNVSKDPIGTNTETGQSSADFEIWDGVGTGFTQAASGDQLTTQIITIGTLDSRIPSKLILGPAKTMTYSFECAEACEVSLSVYVHLI